MRFSLVKWRWHDESYFLRSGPVCGYKRKLRLSKSLCWNESEKIVRRGLRVDHWEPKFRCFGRNCGFVFTLELIKHTHEDEFIEANWRLEKPQRHHACHFDGFRDNCERWRINPKAARDPQSLNHKHKLALHESLRCRWFRGYKRSFWGSWVRIVRLSDQCWPDISLHAHGSFLLHRDLHAI